MIHRYSGVLKFIPVALNLKIEVKLSLNTAIVRVGLIQLIMKVKANLLFWTAFTDWSYSIV